MLFEVFGIRSTHYSQYSVLEVLGTHSLRYLKYLELGNEGDKVRGNTFKRKLDLT